jgi:geranylgeranyl diphosphate synthase type II
MSASSAVRGEGRRLLPFLPKASRRLGRAIVRALWPAEIEWLEAGFRELLPVGAQLEEHLRAVVEETLARPGSLARAQLALASARRYGMPARRAREIAVAIEYFHSASLLFDDLPAMDDARERRGAPCAHLRHGEAAAMLGALALINQGYALLWQVLGRLPRRTSMRAASLVNECLGIAGILDGQARDLHFQSSTRHEADVSAVALGKTVTLIRLTLLLPAVAAGASATDLEWLEELALAWGQAYQITDDFKDLVMDAAESGKSAGRDAALGRPSLPAAIGSGPARERLAAWLRRGREALGHLPRAGGLEPFQTRLEREAAAVATRVQDPPWT